MMSLLCYLGLANSGMTAEQRSAYLDAELSADAKQNVESTLMAPSGGIAHSQHYPLAGPAYAVPQTVSPSTTQWLLQRMAVGLYVVGVLLAPFVFFGIAVLFLFFPPLWLLIPLYVVWRVYDHRVRLSRRLSLPYFGRLSFWSLIADYFPIRIHKTAELPPNKNYLMAVHPRGIFGFGYFVGMGTEALGFQNLFPGFRRRLALGLPNFPLRRELCWLTNTIPSDVGAIERMLGDSDSGQLILVAPGGATEALDSAPNNFKITLQHRRLFIQTALKNGTSLVPVYLFGETETFTQLPNPRGSRIRQFQEFVKKVTGLSVPLFYGAGALNRYIGFLPYRSPINIVVGKPLSVEKIDAPTEAKINELHEQYCKELRALFDAHKHKYADGAISGGNAALYVDVVSYKMRSNLTGHVDMMAIRTHWLQNALEC